MTQYRRPPVVVGIDGRVTVEDPDTGLRIELDIFGVSDGWTLMAVVSRERGRLAVFEDLRERNGPIVYVGTEGVFAELGKSLVPTAVSEETCYRGIGKERIFRSRSDLLGMSFITQAEEPEYGDIAACLQPLRDIRMRPHTFIGSPECADAIPIMYGGYTWRFNPFAVSTEMKAAVEGRCIEEGLIGGYLPVIRMVYPVDGTVDWEMIAFGKGNPASRYVQPAWYRFLRKEEGRLSRVHYWDSYIPYPSKTEPDSSGFYEELLDLHSMWERLLEGGMRISVPEPWIEDFCRHSMVREIITRIGDFPQYGCASQPYGGPEHGGFQDTFNSTVSAVLEWGYFGRAERYIRNYLGEFVRDDGSIDYRGPEIAQYGRMLSTLALYYRYTSDHVLLLDFERRIRAIEVILLERRAAAKELPPDDAAYGMIIGWDEADTCLAHRGDDPYGQEYPFFSLSAEAVRGLHDLGTVWKTIGEKTGRPGLAGHGDALLSEAASLRDDLFRSIERSLVRSCDPPYLPPVAGLGLPGEGDTDSLAYGPRGLAESLHSGVLNRSHVKTIMDYAFARGETFLGILCHRSEIFGGRKVDEIVKIMGFLVYGQAYAFVQHDMVREFLLFYYAHAAHVHTRGTWTAMESTDPDRERGYHYPYCVPAQMTIPCATKWMLVFEEPFEEVLHLAKAVPAVWLEEGKSIAVEGAPTRWGKIGFRIDSRLDSSRVDVSVILPAGEFGAEIRIRIGLPGGYEVESVKTVAGDARTNVAAGRIRMARGSGGEIRMEAFCRKQIQEG